MNTTIRPIRPIHPTSQALRVHRSHLATTHRAPLVRRRAASAATTGAPFEASDATATASRTTARPTAFTPMAPYSLTGEAPRHQSHHQEF